MDSGIDAVAILTARLQGKSVAQSKAMGHFVIEANRPKELTKIHRLPFIGPLLTL